MTDYQPYECPGHRCGKALVVEMVDSRFEPQSYPLCDACQQAEADARAARKEELRKKREAEEERQRQHSEAFARLSKAEQNDADPAVTQEILPVDTLTD